MVRVYASVAPRQAASMTRADRSLRRSYRRASRSWVRAVVMPSANNDMAFSQSMFSALKAVQTEMGGATALEIAYSENMFKVPDAAAAG